MLVRDVMDPIQPLLHCGCSCKEKTVFDYLRALRRTQAWPLNEHCDLGNRSLPQNELLRRLDSFNYKPVSQDCTKCASLNYNSTVGKVMQKVSGSFKGLCLDCIRNSTTRTLRDELDNGFPTRDENCRIKHDASTWFDSFMGSGRDCRAIPEASRR